MVPSVLMAQAYGPPAPTWVKVPAGGVHWPESFCPQQAMLPSVLSPHVRLFPALTRVNAPAGGVLSPE
jgi:hypothetical protein